MKKLELKHLAGYLPYGLKMELLDFPLSKVLGKHYRTLELDCGHDFHFYLSENKVRPILRPLSDLTKEIEVNGEKFVPINRIAIYSPSNLNYFIEQIKTGMVEVIVFNMLLEWHFDIYGLIEKGLAIDINKI